MQDKGKKSEMSENHCHWSHWFSVNLDFLPLSQCPPRFYQDQSNPKGTQELFSMGVCVSWKLLIMKLGQEIMASSWFVWHNFTLLDFSHWEQLQIPMRALRTPNLFWSCFSVYCYIIKRQSLVCFLFFFNFLSVTNPFIALQFFWLPIRPFLKKLSGKSFLMKFALGWKCRKCMCVSVCMLSVIELIVKWKTECYIIPIHLKSKVGC